MNHPQAAQSAAAIARADRRFIVASALVMLLAALFLIYLLVLAPPPALAQDAPIDGKVVLPWGELIAAAIAAGGAAFAAWVTKVLGPMATQWRVNHLLAAALQWALNTTKGAAKNQSVTIDVGNEVVERMLEYAVRFEPQLVEKLGGKEAMRPMAIARVDMDADADAREIIPPRGGVVRDPV